MPEPTSPFMNPSRRRYLRLAMRRISAAMLLWLCATPLTAKVAAVPADSYCAMRHELQEYVADKDARIGIAVIIDGRDTVDVNGHLPLPMLSVYKFPQALAVADRCLATSTGVADTIAVSPTLIKENTWSPMRDRYGVASLRLPLSELLAYTLQLSDNNACDALFDMIGGPQAVDSLMRATGHDAITVRSTEDEMHRDLSLCYANSSTAIEMARLFDSFYRRDMLHLSPVHETIGSLMLTCDTGLNRLPAPLASTAARIAHKTGTGDINADGRIIAVNDAGYVFLPDGRGYAVAVFISDSARGMKETEQMIADISAIIYTNLTQQ